MLVDTLRADHLGAYGNRGGNSPTFDALAAEGIVFERVIAPAPWTQPAVASLFSAVYPGVHRVLSYELAVDGAVFDRPRVAVFDERFATLAEALRDGVCQAREADPLRNRRCPTGPLLIARQYRTRR